MDPRTLRTKEMLKAALLELLQQGVPFHQLSVQKLTKTARLNRTTFYLHYEDIEDIRQHLIEELLYELTDKFEELTDVLQKNRKSQLIVLLQFLQLHREEIILLYQFERLEQYLFDLMYQFIVLRRSRSKKIAKRPLIEPTIKAASIIGIIMWWLKHDTPHSAQEIAEQIHLLYVD